MTDPRSPVRVAPHDAPRHRSRTSRSRRAPAWRVARFGPAALALGTVLGMAAGVGAGVAVDLPVVARPAPVDAEPVLPAPGTGAGAEATADPGSTQDVDVDLSRTAADIPDEHPDDLAGGTAFPKDLLPLALPATPAAIDPSAVDAAGLTFADRQAGLLTAAVPAAASGQLVVVPGSAAAPAPERPVRTVRVEVEAGLDVDPALFAQTVMATLNDPRSWGGDGSMSFARTDGVAELRVVLASPTLTDTLCAPLETVGTFSCGREGRAVLNFSRWVQATPEFADRTVYRQYLVNHEVGHLLGHGHVECPAAGAVAPVMQQQTVGVAPCVVNGWPFPAP